MALRRRDSSAGGRLSDLGSGALAAAFAGFFVAAFFAAAPGLAAAGAADCAVGRSTSVVMNVSHAWRKAAGVFFSPKPYTVRPSSRKRCARRVKSLSLVTRQKPSNRRVYIRSIASMMRELSVAFLPLV